MSDLIEYKVLGGIVQGVGFRYATQKEGNKLGLRGWVRNRSDESVEGVAVGSTEQISRFRTFLSKGPSSAKVKNVEYKKDIKGASDGEIKQALGSNITGYETRTPQSIEEMSMILIPTSSLDSSSDPQHSFATHSFDLYQSRRLLSTTPTTTTTTTINTTTTNNNTTTINNNTTLTHHGSNTYHCRCTLHYSWDVWYIVSRAGTEEVHTSLFLLYTRDGLTSRARHLFLKGWLRWLPDHAEVLVGIAVGDPIHVRAFADFLGRNEVPSGHVTEIDCFRWEDDISDHEQVLSTRGLQGFEIM